MLFATYCSCLVVDFRNNYKKNRIELPQRDKVNELLEYCRLETNIWESNTYYSRLETELSVDNNDLSILQMIANEERKMNSFVKRFKKGIATIWNSFRRSISFIDLFTDLRLLYLVSIGESPIISFIIILSVSLVCPYIVSYSCGIKLFHINRDNNYDIKNLNESNSFDGYVALKKLVAYLTLSPVGVFYFVFLDLIDIVFVYYKLFCVVFLNKNEIELKMLEEMAAKQLGMTRMDYEGIKRQRATAQMMFETIPQAIVQFLLLVNVFGNGDSLSVANVEPLDVCLSILSAILNSLFQILRLKLESEACNEKFSEYCVECLMARISWIPFEKHIARFLNGPRQIKHDPDSEVPDPATSMSDTKVLSVPSESDSDSQTISYDIKYCYPCGISDMMGYKPKLEFDFSSNSIQKLISTIRLSNTAKENRMLKINFGKSLRLINFQDLMNLFDVCLEKEIEIIGFNNESMAHLLSNAMNISASAAKDARLLSNCRNSFGKPFVGSLLSLAKIFCASSHAATAMNEDSLLSTMFECLIINDFNPNVNDKRSGETIIFDLIRQNKCTQFLLLLKKFVKEKQNRLMLNYYNYSGVSPLYLAITQHIRDKKQQQQVQPQQHAEKKEYEYDEVKSEEKEEIKIDMDKTTETKRSTGSMYEILIENTSEVASVNFPAFENNDVVRSCLASVIIEKEWKMVDKLLAKGAVLNLTEVSVLIEVYLDLAYDKDPDIAAISDKFKILEKLMHQCHICHKHLIDENGNNPIHKIFQGIDDFYVKTEKQHIQAISTLLTMCRDWMFMENNSNKLPIQYLFEAMLPDRKGVNFEHVQLCDEVVKLLKQDFQSVFTKLASNGRLVEYPICVSYLRMLMLFGSYEEEENKRESYVSLLTHFENVIFDETISGTVLLSNTKDLTIDVTSAASIEKFVETRFSHKPVSVDFFMKSLFVESESGISELLVDTGDVLAASTVLENLATLALPVLPSEKFDNFGLEEKKNESGAQTNVDEKKDGDEDEEDKKERETLALQLLQQDKEENKKPLTWIELVYVLCVESLSCADLITDFIILDLLISDKEVWWSTFSVIFMISPYLVSYTAMGSMLQKKSDELSLIVMTPLCLIYFMILDVVFMFYALFSSFIFLFSFGNIQIGDWMEEHFFYNCLKVTRVELTGYRRLRTLAQLLFETFPSLILQLRILSSIDGNNNSDNKLKLTPESLFLSIFFAMSHMFFEGVIIKLDSSACHLSMYEYCIVCMNARLSWIPYANILIMKSVGNNNNSIINNSSMLQMNKLFQFASLNFEEIVSNFMCLKYKLDFEFGKDSWKILTKYINNIVEFAPSNFNSDSYNNTDDQENVAIELIDAGQLLGPLLTDTIANAKNVTTQQKCMVLKNETFSAIHSIVKLEFGKRCCKNLDLFDIYELYQIASNKVLIDCSTVDWQRMISLTRVDHGQVLTRQIVSDLKDLLVSVGDLSALYELNTKSSAHADISLGNMSTHNVIGLARDKILKNARFNILPLKKCFDKNIMYGMTCDESNKLYLMVYQLLQSQLSSVHEYSDGTVDELNIDNSGNYTVIFDNGQYFFTAMMLLFFTQGTIYGKSHRCFECGKDWIDHLQQFDNRVKNSDYATNYQQSTRPTAISNIRNKMKKLFTIYLPKEIEIVDSESDYSNNDKASIPLESIHVSRGLRKTFGDYLFKRAYFYSLATRAVTNGAGSRLLDNLLTQLSQDKPFLVKSTYLKEGEIEILPSWLSTVAADATATEMFDEEKMIHRNKNESRTLFFLYPVGRLSEYVLTTVELMLKFEHPLMFVNFMKPKVWDGLDEKNVFMVHGYLISTDTKISMGKSPIGIEARKVKNASDIKLAWDVKDTHNENNNVSIHGVEIHVEILDAFIDGIDNSKINTSTTIHAITSQIRWSITMNCHVEYHKSKNGIW